MAVITFDEAITMTTDSVAWMKKVSDFIKDPEKNPAPTDIYASQNLAFEIDTKELKGLLESSEKIVGIMGYEAEKKTLSLIFVGTDGKYNPSAANPPRETWPRLKGNDDLNDVLKTYLKP
jgi:hypothetical protein